MIQDANGTATCGTGDTFPRRRFPCGECPIRSDNADNPRSKFPAERWDALTASVVDPDTGFGPSFDAPLFGCHKGEPGTDADLACAGWLARFGRDHPVIRFALTTGRLPEEALTPGPNWPPLHPTWREVVAHQTGTPLCAAGDPSGRREPSSVDG